MLRGKLPRFVCCVKIMVGSSLPFIKVFIIFYYCFVFFFCFIKAISFSKGMYNAITRMVEPELLPCLRRFGLRFYAYNATAGGLLCGKYKSVDDVPQEGRFALSEHYRERFWSEANFEALNVLREACEAGGVSMPDAANRWLANHSALDATLGDAVIVGASKPGHVRANVAACRTTAPLPAPILAAFDSAWQVARPHCVKVIIVVFVYIFLSHRIIFFCSIFDLEEDEEEE
jgi:hypothetical protein